MRGRALGLVVVAGIGLNGIEKLLRPQEII
jgi:hypothetical protein